jgi:hypothetical protein
MEAIAVLVTLGLLAIVVSSPVLAIVALVRASQLGRQLEALQVKLKVLERHVEGRRSVPASGVPVGQREPEPVPEPESVSGTAPGRPKPRPPLPSRPSRLALRPRRARLRRPGSRSSGRACSGSEGLRGSVRSPS